MNGLSVIIVNWNTKEYLLGCLSSFIQRKEEYLQEVILVDNGSQDGSVAEVRRLFPEVLLIENGQNLGFAKAVNQGLRIARGEYLLLLNPDTQFKNNALQRLMTFMERHPEVGIAGGQLIHEDGSKQNSIANYPSLATELFNKNLLRWLWPERFPGKGREYPQPIEVDSVIGACMMVRREAIEQVGLLDEDYFLFLEETDWCYRMKRAGWKVYHVPHAEVYHFQGKSAERDKKRAKVEYYRSRYIFFNKHKGFLQYFILRVGLFIKLVVECLSMTSACILTGFRVRRWRNRLKIFAYLLWWHLKGCSEGMGLKPLSA